MSLPRKSSGVDTLQKLRADLKTLEDRRVVLLDIQEPINKELISNFNEMEVLKDKIGKLQLTSSKKVDWELLLTEGTGKSVHDRFDEELRKRGLFGDGVMPATKQRCIKVMLKRRNKLSFDKTMKALKEILPFIKPFPDGVHAGYKFVDVFEKTLSERGAYYWLIDEVNNIYRLVVDVYYRTTELKRFKSLGALVKYTQEHYPYED